MNYQFRKAELSEIPQIWTILQQAIARRKADGSQQWQNGYPNPDAVRNDMAKGVGFVLADGQKVIGYSAVLINDEPAYANIDGQWLSNGDFVVVHRVAISEDYLGQGLVQQMFLEIEKYAIGQNIYSIKVDTNFDNLPMLRIVEKLGYTYCGEVILSGAPRKAFEKLLQKS
ncbi:GNAT family N-acetyltransferase [Flavobacterium sp. CYK-4]|uniref:GNAT family N-acetyltransferase n=1 Tax=Flavobacterium lotistagni TaxID=2709660 RepID=UPI00140CC9D9|nr:GNAT family N-acetyltransferase [Flavobacterium lotistagni]NHM07839.1 GNAT family N-acetyltransferase [Flavobacterium lotistagni]